MIQINEPVTFQDGEVQANGAVLEARNVSAERTNNGPVLGPVTGGDKAAKRIDIDGDLTEKLKDGAIIEWQNHSGANDGEYTLSADAVYNAGADKTEITVAEAIADDVFDGDVEYQDLTWYLRAKELWWRNLVHCQSVAGDAEKAKSAPQLIEGLTPQFKVTKAELEAGDWDALYSTKRKAQFDTVYAEANVVIL